VLTVAKKFKMRVFTPLLFLATVFGAPADLEERDVVPAACQQPLPLSLAYDVLEDLHATSFCSSWLKLSTMTVTGECSYLTSYSLLN
jgi:hypothetical protein